MAASARSFFFTEMEMQRPTGFNAGEYTFSVQSAMVEVEKGRLP